MQPSLYWDNFDSPLGTLTIVVDQQRRLVHLRLDGSRPAGTRGALRCTAARSQLREYFDGVRQRFDLALNPTGTEFQKRVWLGLTAIRYGEVCNYGELARRIGKPGAARAVGQANGANPIPIVVPCHRVIASDGSIGGYSGGTGIKHRLLALEGYALAA
jgi:methylated-DNA-[protein]-cysteine S-methyltransferase